MSKNPLEENTRRQKLEACKDDVFSSIQKVLSDAGVEDADLNSIEISVRRAGPKCPPPTKPTLEVIERPDGSLVYQMVCK